MTRGPSSLVTVANYPLFGERFAAATAATIPILSLCLLLQPRRSPYGA